MGQHGGILHVHKKVGEYVAQGEIIASVVDVFGTVLAEYGSPWPGIVIGRSTNPVSVQGDRIIHLGTIAPKDAVFATEVDSSDDEDKEEKLRHSPWSAHSPHAQPKKASRKSKPRKGGGDDE